MEQSDISSVWLHVALTSLRVPPLLVLDSVLSSADHKSLFPEWYPGVQPLSVAHLTLIASQVFCGLLALVMFMLSKSQLLSAYGFIMSALALVTSYHFNNEYINTETESENYRLVQEPWKIIQNNFQGFGINIFAQLIASTSYNLCRNSLQKNFSSYPWNLLRNYHGLQTYMCFLQPTIWRLIAIEPTNLQTVSLISVLLVGLEYILALLLNVQAVIQTSKDSYLRWRTLLREHGIQVFVETQWMRLHIPLVLRILWIIQTLHVIIYTTLTTSLNPPNTDPDVKQIDVARSYLSLEFVAMLIHETLVYSCDTVVALLATTSVISLLVHYLGLLMIQLVGSDNEEDRNMGTMSAILFFILALQTGLTGLPPDKRMVRLCRNFCLLSTAILHFVHSMVHPLMMNLSASQAGSKSKHCRVLAMCCFLLGFPIWFLTYLWSQYTLSTWLLAVTAFSIEVMIKVIISLLIYALFMIDARREIFWEKLDDYVYYIRSTGNTIEFLFGIFLFCNGLWILVFESGGAIRACMMCIHAYFNIWMQAKEGWKVFIKRRTAVQKIDSLPEATVDQLISHNDVCAICYQELNTARITRCGHYFHGVCLRKWLYVQDKCPLCHQLIYKTGTEDEPDSEAEDANNDEHLPNGVIENDH